MSPDFFPPHYGSNETVTNKFTASVFELFLSFGVGSNNWIALQKIKKQQQRNRKTGANGTLWWGKDNLDMFVLNDNRDREYLFRCIHFDTRARYNWEVPNIGPSSGALYPGNI